MCAPKGGGTTLSAPKRVAGPLAFQVRLTTDATRPRRVYLTWVRASEVGLIRFAGPDNPIEVTRSDDGGRTWRSPVRVSALGRERVLVLGRSADGGATWRESLVDDRVVPTRRFIAFLPPFPSLAVDHRDGRIFVAFEDGRLSPSDVHLWSLARGQRRWSGPTRVNDTAERDGTSQYLPKIAVARDGRMDVAYYDRRRDAGNHLNEVSLQ